MSIMTSSLSWATSDVNMKRIKEVEKAIESLEKSLLETHGSSQLEARLKMVKLKRELIRAMEAVVRTEKIFSEVDILIAESKLAVKLKELNKKSASESGIPSAKKIKLPETKHSKAVKATSVSTTKPSTSKAKPDDKHLTSYKKSTYKHSHSPKKNKKGYSNSKVKKRHDQTKLNVKCTDSIKLPIVSGGHNTRKTSNVVSTTKASASNEVHKDSNIGTQTDNSYLKNNLQSSRNIVQGSYSNIRRGYNLKVTPGYNLSVIPGYLMENVQVSNILTNQINSMNQQPPTCTQVNNVNIHDFCNGENKILASSTASTSTMQDDITNGLFHELMTSKSIKVEDDVRSVSSRKTLIITIGE